MPIPTDEERIGTLVSERYRLEAILGQGGMGVVFGGSHTWTGRGVAVKILKPDYATDAEGVRRFLQEARSAASIDHPNVIDVLDMGSDEDGTVFMVLERLEGQTLGERLDESGRLDVTETLEVMLPVLAGLESAHAAGVLHRDIKPDNIFIATDGAGRRVPKVLDFGMSKVLEAGLGTTDSGAVLGTPYYMAPEQAEGASSVGPPADVWAAGAVLYHCLAGRRPYDGPSAPTILLRIARGEHEPLTEAAPHVHPAIAEVVERALALSLDARWPDARSLGEALRAGAEEAGLALATDAFQAPDAAPAPRGRSSAPPARLRLGLGLGAVALLSGIGAVGWLAAGPIEPPSGEDEAVVVPPREAPPPATEHAAIAPAVTSPAVDPVARDRVATIEAPPPAPLPRVEIVSEPPGADVVVDGEVRCQTPCGLDTGSSLRASVRLRGHRPRALDLAAGQTGTLELALEPRPTRRADGPVDDPRRDPVPALPETPF